MKTRLANLQVDVSRETGEVMLLVETACGLRPVMGWPDVNGMHTFAENLLGICENIHHKDADDTLDNIGNSLNTLDHGE